MALDDPYTHNFKYFIGVNGQNRIEGDCEFDSDQKMTFKITDTSDPFPLETLNSFMELMNLLKKLYDSSGGFKQISIKSKVV